MSALTSRQKRYLRSVSHSSKPLVIIGGNGLTQSVMDEIRTTIDYHELIKVRVNATDNDERTAMIEKICEELGCELVFSIGHVATLYKENKTGSRNPKSELKLPK